MIESTEDKFILDDWKQVLEKLWEDDWTNIKISDKEWGQYCLEREKLQGLQIDII